MILTAILRDEDGQSVGALILSPKTFSSGNVGWHGQGKLEIDGQRCQCQAQAVIIQAKDGADGQQDG